MYENPSVFSLKELSPRRRAAQFLMPRVDLDDDLSVERAEVMVRDFGVCGFIVFGGSVERIRETTGRLQSFSEVPLLFGCDVERGLGQRVRDATLFPFAMAQGAADDPSLAARQAEATAREMKYCGLNLAFAPVLDVNTEPRNPIINVRSFSDDPSAVAKLGVVFVETLQKEGVMACAKHFPGHGATSEDSHVELPRDGRSSGRIMETDIPPFREAVAARLSAVMPAHVSYPSLSPGGLPSTLSPDVLGGLLRKKLGFGGLVVSDSFMMDALGGEAEEEENVVAALSAGADIVLDPRDPVGFLEKREEDRFFSTPARAESLARIFHAKKLFASKKNNSPTPDFAANRSLAAEISARSACLAGGAPLRGREAFIVYYSANGPEAFMDVLNETLCRKGVRVEGRSSLSGNLPEIPPDLSLLCVILTEPAARAESCLVPSYVAARIDGLSRFPGEKALVSFGSPYPIGRFGFFETAVALFDSSAPAVAAAAEVLLGLRPSTAKIPVDMSR